MWYEFPKDETMIGLDTQFMFGGSLLVCPKLVVPDNDKKVWNVNCTFPEDKYWYNWYDKLPYTWDTGKRSIDLPDEEQGIWVSGGSILPILQHTDEMSLLHALGNNITLEIYPN